jgi:hypothetical protein
VSGPAAIALGLYLIPACLVLTLAMWAVRSMDRGEMDTPSRDCPECGTRAEWASVRSGFAGLRDVAPGKVAVFFLLLALMWPATITMVQVMVVRDRRQHRAHAGPPRHARGKEEVPGA